MTDDELVSKLFSLLRGCCDHTGEPYLSRGQFEIDVPPRPVDSITIDGAFDTRCLLDVFRTSLEDK